MHGKRRISDGRTRLIVTAEQNKTNLLFCENLWGHPRWKSQRTSIDVVYLSSHNSSVSVCTHSSQNDLEICPGKDTRHPIFKRTLHSVPGMRGRSVNHNYRSVLYIGRYRHSQGFRLQMDFRLCRNLTHCHHKHVWGWVVNALRRRFTPRTEPRYPMCRKLGEPQEEKIKSSAPTGIRTPNSPACNELLHWLRYPGCSYVLHTHTHTHTYIHIYIYIYIYM
jgi:hypothetical protein